MSEQFEFKISTKHLIANSAIVLLGILVASVFLRFSSAELLQNSLERLESYFVFNDTLHVLLLIFQECFWLLLIIALAMIPYGKLLSSVILFYKGFSIGVVASIFCKQYGLLGLKHILLLLLPQNLLYIISLCVTAQISMEIASNTVNRGRHGKIIKTDVRAYIVCFILTVLAALLEAVGVPWVYKILF